MKKLFMKIRSEEGAANVVEAIIVYPIVFLAVAFLLILGFTYVQEGFLNYESQKLSDYLAKVVIYPGYANIERPDYAGTENTVSIGDLNAAMQKNTPYRYMFGIFGSETGIEDHNSKDLAAEYARYMAKEYLSEHGYLKSYSGKITVPEEFGPEHTIVNSEDGYACAIRATTSQVEVYLAQNYIFGRFFSMIDMGNKRIVVSAKGISAVSDSLEIVKTTDMSVDMVTFLGNLLGFDASKITTIKDMIQGN